MLFRSLLCAAFALAFVNYNIESPKSWQSVVYKVLATAGMVGLVLGAVYVLVMVARASFHEGTILRNRRHSLRLGRLFLYLKLTSASNAHDLRELKKSQLNAIEMESIFGWNLESSSAFKDIKGEAVTGTLFGQVLQTVQKGLEAFKPVK